MREYEVELVINKKTGKVTTKVLNGAGPDCAKVGDFIASKLGTKVKTVQLDEFVLGEGVQNKGQIKQKEV